MPQGVVPSAKAADLDPVRLEVRVVMPLVTTAAALGAGLAWDTGRARHIPAADGFPDL